MNRARAVSIPCSTTRRGWVRGAAAGLSGVALAACGGGESRSPDGTGAATLPPATIHHMAWNAPKDIDAPQQVAARFAAKSPGVNVVVEPPGGNNYEKLDTLLAADQEPDTFYLQGWLWQSYAGRGALLDLAPLIAKDRGFPSSTVFAKPHVDQTQWQGRTYMVPNDTGGFVLFFNKDLFQRAGVAFPNERWTWDDWFQAAGKLSTGEGSDRVYGYQAQESWRRNAMWVKQAGAECWDRIVGPSASRLDDATVIDTVQRQVDMRLRYRFSPPVGDGATIYNGRTAMVVEGDWVMETFKKDGRIAWDVAPLPRNKRQATVLLVHGSSASARGKRPDAAWAWLKYYTTEEAQTLHVTASGRVAITPELAKKVFLPIARDTFGAEHPEVFLTRWEYGSHYGITDLIDPVEKQAINPAFTAAFRGEQPVASALREAARLTNELLKSSRMVGGR
jgi:multiple sugar transport system substrate-binding protein